MELREYLKILKKYLLFIIIWMLLGALLAVIVVKSTGRGTSWQQNFLVVVPSEPLSVSGQNFRYEGYFAQEKAANFTDTAVAVLTSVDFTGPFLPAGYSLSSRKVAPQLVRITAVGVSEAETKRLIAEAAGRFNQKMAEWQSPSPPRLVAIAQDPKPASAPPRKVVVSVFGAVVGTTFALTIIALKTYFRV